MDTLGEREEDMVADAVPLVPVADGVAVAVVEAVEVCEGVVLPVSVVDAVVVGVPDFEAVNDVVFVPVPVVVPVPVEVGVTVLEIDVVGVWPRASSTASEAASTQRAASISNRERRALSTATS